MISIIGVRDVVWFDRRADASFSQRLREPCFEQLVTITERVRNTVALEDMIDDHFARHKICAAVAGEREQSFGVLLRKCSATDGESESERAWGHQLTTVRRSEEEPWRIHLTIDMSHLFGCQIQVSLCSVGELDWR